MNGEEKRRHGAVVYRRDYSEGEIDRRTQILFDCGGIYDEQLDDDESVREFKRRRTGDNHSPPPSDDEEMKASALAPKSSPDKSDSLGEKVDGSDSLTPHNDGSASPVISDSDSE